MFDAVQTSRMTLNIKNSWGTTRRSKTKRAEYDSEIKNLCSPECASAEVDTGDTQKHFYDFEKLVCYVA